MEKLPVEDLKLGDLVLVESQVGRYTEKDPENTNIKIGKQNNKDKGRDFGWKVRFELSSVSLLRECPLSLSDAAEASKICI